MGEEPVERLCRIRGDRQLRLSAAVAIKAPGLEADRRPPIAQREGNLGQRAQTTTEGDDTVRGPGEHRVAGMTQPGGNRDIDVLVGFVRVVTGQPPGRRAPRAP